MKTRLLALLTVLSLASLLHAQSQDPAPPAPDTDAELRWIDASDLKLTGKGWQEPEHPYRRLPAHAEAVATPAVWRLAHHTAGITLHFVTDATEIHAFWSAGGAMNHMPASGVSGLDLYRRDANGDWAFAAVGRPNPEPTTRRLTTNPAGHSREYLLFLPLYQEVEFLQIGVNPDAAFSQPAEDPDRKPIVFYGTSIVQGGCASRTGMAHAAILRRWLDREVINLGFSGSGKMEMPMADLLAEVDASLYVLDCLPNMTQAMVDERYEAFIRRLRAARPDTPILLVEHLTLSRGHERNLVVQRTFEKLRGEGWEGLELLPGDRLLAGREQATVDGTHPTDLGFFRMAEAHEPLMRKLLGE